ncbi:MAG: hypothetical protein JW822_02835 [Spirochaetales bacterium]|nr:hypothetical protein [Spirochaetales bacterium]
MVNGKILIIFGILCLLAVCLVHGQEINVPEPYEEDEFPQWLQDLRRAEIIFFGSLPFTLLISLQGYEITRYFINDMDPLYTPWPFRSTQAPAYSFEEQMAVIGSAVVISGLIALTDYIIGKITRREEEELRQP